MFQVSRFKFQDADAGCRSYIGIGCSRWGESHSPYRTFQVSGFRKTDFLKLQISNVILHNFIKFIKILLLAAIFLFTFVKNFNNC